MMALVRKALGFAAVCSHAAVCSQLGLGLIWSLFSLREFAGLG